MPCALTQGFATFDCRDNVGGIKAIWFIPYSDVTTITEASGTVSAITKSSGKVFYKYLLTRNTGSYTQTITGNIENGTVFFEQSLVVILNKMQVNMRNEILLLSRNTMMAVVEDQNGRYWLAGKLNGLDLLSGSADTGTAAGDRNGFSLTFTGSERELACEVQSSVIATLTT